MYTDYKISRFTVSGGQTTIKINIYEGDITTEDEFDEFGNAVSITRYRRTGKRTTETYTIFDNLTKEEVVAESNGKLRTEATAGSLTIIDEQDDGTLYQNPKGDIRK